MRCFRCQLHQSHALDHLGRKPFLQLEITGFCLALFKRLQKFLDIAEHILEEPQVLDPFQIRYGHCQIQRFEKVIHADLDLDRLLHSILFLLVSIDPIRHIDKLLNQSWQLMALLECLLDPIQILFQVNQFHLVHLGPIPDKLLQLVHHVCPIANQQFQRGRMNIVSNPRDHVGGGRLSVQFFGRLDFLDVVVRWGLLQRGATLRVSALRLSIGISEIACMLLLFYAVFHLFNFLQVHLVMLLRHLEQRVEALLNFLHNLVLNVVLFE